ncbi:MAG TPA: hypothetical protein VMU17_02060, partial [Elusimicrobiota bacterium]|nr:hypothetical protein [Elusimicrobiota bacterium]
VVIRRIPLEGAADDLRTWFDRASSELEKSDQGRSLATAALGALIALGDDADPNREAWWRTMEGTVWASEIRQLKLYTVRTLPP